MRRPLKEAEERRQKQLTIDEANVHVVAQQHDEKNKKSEPLKQDRTPKQLPYLPPLQPVIYAGAGPYPSNLLPATFGIGQQLFLGAQGKHCIVYRVIHNISLKIMAYFSQNMSLRDFPSLLGAHQMWSI